MPIETLEDIAEEMANRIGIYGTCEEEDGGRCPCPCRCHFIAGLLGRMRSAVHIEDALRTQAKGEEDV